MNANDNQLSLIPFIQSGRWLGKTGLAVVLAIGLGGLAVGCWGEDSAQPKTGQPVASCPGYSVDAEKIIKADPALVKLEHFVDITFKAAISLTYYDEQLRIQDEQCKWIAKTNQCNDSSCIKNNLQSRFDFLSDSNYENSKYENSRKNIACPESAFMDHESDNVICVKRIISKYNFKVSWRDKGDAEVCKAMFQDLASGNSNFEYVEPTVRTDDKNNPLIKSLTECQGDGTMYSLGKAFRLYQLSSGQNDKASSVEWLYQEGGGISIPHEGLTGAASTIYDYIALFDTESCNLVSYFSMLGNQSEFVNTMVKYKGKYYFLMANPVSIYLDPYDVKNHSFGYNKICGFNRREDKTGDAK